MTAYAAKRLRPNPQSAAEIGTRRDLDFLSTLYWAGMLTMPQIERLYFPSRRRAQQRMRALLDRGFVRAHLQGDALHRPNVYTLAPAGRSFLIDAGRLAPDAAPPRALPRRSKLAHALAVREVFTAFLAAERAGQLRLDDFRFDDDLCAEPMLRGAKVVPDALALVTRDEETRTIGIEVDLGTEPHTVLKAKLGTWHHLLLGRGTTSSLPTSTTLLLVTPREGRRTSLLRLARDAGLATRATVILSDETGPTIAAGWPWRVFAPPLRAERRGDDAEDAGFTALSSDEDVAFRPLGRGGADEA